MATKAISQPGCAPVYAADSLTHESRRLLDPSTVALEDVNKCVFCCCLLLNESRCGAVSAETSR